MIHPELNVDGGILDLQGQAGLWLDSQQYN